MGPHEVYPNPTVTQVIFQVRFPNLFYIESKIGEYQLRVMERFPTSALLHRRSIVIADLGPEANVEGMPPEVGPPGLRSIWRFESEEGVRLHVQGDSLDLSSGQHKTYDAAGEANRFRDVIEFAVQNFLAVVPIPVFARIGLRYIDDCPLPEITNEAFTTHYNTTFPLGRYPLPEADHLEFAAAVHRGKYSLRFKETFRREDKAPKLTLDFDACAENIRSDGYLSTTDDLHVLIHDEYESVIKDAVRDIMRRPKEQGDVS